MTKPKRKAGELWKQLRPKVLHKHERVKRAWHLRLAVDEASRLLEGRQPSRDEARMALMWVIRGDPELRALGVPDTLIATAVTAVLNNLSPRPAHEQINAVGRRPVCEVHRDTDGTEHEGAEATGKEEAADTQ